MRLRNLFLFVSLALAAVACGTPGGDDDDDAASPTPTLGNEVQLAGTFALQVVNSQIFDGVLGQDTVVLTTVSQMTIDHTPGTTTIEATSEVCGVEMTPYADNETTYPAATIAAIPVETTTMTLSEAKEGASFTSPASVRLIGWTTSADPATDPIPTDGADSRVVDSDSDSNPGVTLQVNGAIVSGDIYIVNRSAVTLDGTIVSADRVEGLSVTQQEQTILGASDPLLELGNVTATPDPDSSASTFQLVRVPDTDTCASIMANAGTLFN